MPEPSRGECIESGRAGWSANKSPFIVHTTRKPVSRPQRMKTPPKFYATHQRRRFQIGGGLRRNRGDHGGATTVLDLAQVHRGRVRREGIFGPNFDGFELNTVTKGGKNSSHGRATFTTKTYKRRNFPRAFFPPCIVILLFRVTPGTLLWASEQTKDDKDDDVPDATRVRRITPLNLGWD